MQIRKRIGINIAFQNGQAEQVLADYKRLKAKGYGHSEVYLAGQRALKDEVAK